MGCQPRGLLDSTIRMSSRGASLSSACYRIVIKRCGLEVHRRRGSRRVDRRHVWRVDRVQLEQLQRAPVRRARQASRLHGRKVLRLQGCGVAGLLAFPRVYSGLRPSRGPACMRAGLQAPAAGRHQPRRAGRQARQAAQRRRRRARRRARERPGRCLRAFLCVTTSLPVILA